MQNFKVVKSAKVVALDFSAVSTEQGMVWSTCCIKQYPVLKMHRTGYGLALQVVSKMCGGHTQIEKIPQVVCGGHTLPV